MSIKLNYPLLPKGWRGIMHCWNPENTVKLYYKSFCHIVKLREVYISALSILKPSHYIIQLSLPV
jgi:hypothetical protein